MAREYQVLKDSRILRAMEKQKLITFAPQTLTKITGLYSNKSFTCYYVDDAPSNFEFRGKKYGLKYFDGCFYPYIVEYIN